MKKRKIWERVQKLALSLVSHEDMTRSVNYGINDALDKIRDRLEMISGRATKAEQTAFNAQSINEYTAFRIETLERNVETLTQMINGQIGVLHATNGQRNENNEGHAQNLQRSQEG